MSHSSSVIRVIRSASYPGVHLRPYAEKFSDSDGITVGHGRNLLDEFILAAPPAGGASYTTSLVSSYHPVLSICMDALAAGNDRQPGKASVRPGEPEKFNVVQHSDGSVSFESTHVPGVFLSLQMHPDSPGIKPLFCCRKEARDTEHFFLEPAAEQPMLRVMTYNLHLMKDSFISQGKALRRKVAFDEPDVFEDEARRDLIVHKIVDSLADVVSLQEVWDLGWEYWFGERLAQVYPYVELGPRHEVKDDFFGIKVFTATSGVMLLSKFPLSHPFGQRYPNMSDKYERLSDKGILCATVDTPDMGSIRFGTTHASTDTGGAHCEDIRWLAETTMKDGGKAVILGDFNVHPDKYYSLHKAITSYGPMYDVAEQWRGTHQQEPYEGRTIDMPNNLLDQYFSMQRDTANASIIDYIWTTADHHEMFHPRNLQIPRDWKYKSRRWHWAHPYKASGMPSVADHEDRQVVVAMDGVDRNQRAAVVTAVYRKETKKWTHHYAGFETRSSPGIIHFEGKFQVFYREERANRILQRSSDDGINWSDATYIGFDTGGGICPVRYRDRLYLLFVTPEPNGGPILRIIKEKAGWGRSSWSDSAGIGIHTRADISATVLNGRLFVVSFEGAQGNSSGIMLSILDSSDKWTPRHPAHLHSSGAPGIVAFNNELHLFYRHNEGDAIFYARTPDGVQWPENNYNIGRDSAYNGVCPVVLDGKIRLLYAFHNPGEKGSNNYFPHTTMLHSDFPDMEVDLSDHYPMIADLDFHRRFLDITVHQLNGESMEAANNAWAGRKGKSQPLDIFTIDASLLGENISISYKAYVRGHGETAWINAGHPCGVDNMPIEGFEIRLEGEDAHKYELSYQAHFEGIGDQPLVPANALCSCGGRKIEAIRVCIKPVITR